MAKYTLYSIPLYIVEEEGKVPVALCVRADPGKKNTSTILSFPFALNPDTPPFVLLSDGMEKDLSVHEQEDLFQAAKNWYEKFGANHIGEKSSQKLH